MQAKLAKWARAGRYLVVERHQATDDEVKAFGSWKIVMKPHFRPQNLG